MARNPGAGQGPRWLHRLGTSGGACELHQRHGASCSLRFVNDIGRRVVCSEEPVACESLGCFAHETLFQSTERRGSRGGEGRSHEAPLALLSAEGNGPKWEWLKRFGQSHSVEILGPLQKEPSFAVSRETARKKFCAVRGPPEAGSCNDCI